MYTLNRTPATVIRRWVVTEGKYAGQEFAEVLCDGERDYIPSASLTEVKPTQGDDFSCHYCGGPAVTFDFFDAPICRDCQ